MITENRPDTINFKQYSTFLRKANIVYTNINTPNIVNISINMFADLENRLQKLIGTLDIHSNCPHTICLYSFKTFPALVSPLNMYTNKYKKRSYAFKHYNTFKIIQYLWKHLAHKDVDLKLNHKY